MNHADWPNEQLGQPVSTNAHPAQTMNHADGPNVQLGQPVSTNAHPYLPCYCGPAVSQQNRSRDQYLPHMHNGQGPLQHGGSRGPVLRDMHDSVLGNSQGQVLHGSQGQVLHHTYGSFLHGTPGPASLHGTHGPAQHGPHGPVQYGTHYGPLLSIQDNESTSFLNNNNVNQNNFSFNSGAPTRESSERSAPNMLTYAASCSSTATRPCPPLNFHNNLPSVYGCKPCVDMPNAADVSKMGSRYSAGGSVYGAVPRHVGGVPHHVGCYTNQGSSSVVMNK